MIEEMLQREVTTPPDLVERVLRSTGTADLASLHPSPVGPVVVVRRRDAVTAVCPEQFADETLAGYERRTGVPAYQEDSPPSAWSDTIEAALVTGRSRHVTTALVGVGEFQRAVLEATSTIPVGETRPYAWVAREMGKPGAVRAVGTALAKNPIPLLIPCHRVVRSDGSLGQYAFGPPMKSALLESEHVEPRLESPLVASRRGEVVCYPTCRHARRIKDAVGFSSMAGALAQGYRPCRTCRPG